MSGDDRQNSPSISRQNRPSATVDELNEKVWGEGFYATIISKGKFDEIWNTGIYNESLTAT